MCRKSGGNSECLFTKPAADSHRKVLANTQNDVAAGHSGHPLADKNVWRFLWPRHVLKHQYITPNHVPSRVDVDGPDDKTHNEYNGASLSLGHVNGKKRNPKTPWNLLRTMEYDGNISALNNATACVNLKCPHCSGTAKSLRE